MPQRNAGKSLLTALAAVLLTATLAGCGTTDNSMAGYFADPAKFILYSCPALAERASEVAERERELQALMAKAERDGGGRAVSALAYRNEYLATRGEMLELEKAAANKNCPPLQTAPKPPRRSSLNVIN